MSRIIKQVREAQEEIKAIQRRIVRQLKGRRVRIISKYNGQPYGSSRKPWTGREGIIEQASLDEYDCLLWLDIMQWGQPAIELNEVVILDEDVADDKNRNAD